MSQPPGPYGAPGQYGDPGRYGAPGAAGVPGPYGQPRPGPATPPPPPGPYRPPAQYGGPGPQGPGGGFGPGGYGGPPQRRRVWPWLVTAAVVLVAGIGVLLFVLLSDDDSDTTAGPPVPTASTTAGGGMDGQEIDPDVELPTGAQVPMEDTDDPAGEEEIQGSTELAATFLDALVEGDGAYALDLIGADLYATVEQQATENGITPEEFLVAVFYERVLDNEEITDAELVSIEYDERSGLEAITIAIGTASTERTLTVYVDEDLLVADLELP